MKNLLFIAFCLFVKVDTFEQGSENFENISPALSASYSNGSFVGDNSVTWNYVESRNNGGYAITGESLMLRQSSNQSSLSTTVAGGIGDFTCELKKAFTGSGNRQVELFVNGVSYGISVAFDNTTVQTFSVTGINQTGNITIEIRNITGNQVVIDNISWTGYNPGPTVSFNAATSTATEGNTILIPVTMSNYSSGPVILDVTLGVANTGNNTYELGDITLNTTSLTFSGNGSGNISITINQDIDADDEVLEISISEQTSTGINIATALNTLTITDNEIPIAGDLVINEINYNPSGDDDPYEFIEIYNASGHHLNISGLTFTNGVTYTFPTGTTIDAAEYIIVARTAATYFGNGYPVYEYSGNLTNTGATITLKDGNNITIDEVIYGISSSWLTTPNGTGVSLSLFATNQNTTDNDNASSWGASCAINGTPGSANLNCSAESEIVAVATSEATSISSLENTASPLSATDGVQVWQFTINEGGSDLTDDDVLSSVINSLVITEKVGQDAVNNWTDALKSAAIFDGTTHLGTATIAQSSLTFSGSPLISIPDGTSKTLSLRISLNENIAETTIDNEDFVFQITDGNVTTPTDGTSSSFEFITIQSTDNKNKIEVIGTALSFNNQPNDVFVNYPMSDVIVNGVDANGNIDEDFTTDISITSTGTLTGSPITETPSLGTAIFSSLIHTTLGTNLTLTASTTGYSNVISTTFEVKALTVSAGDLIISEYMAAPAGVSFTNGEYFELYNTTNTAIDINGWTIKDDGSDNHIISSGNGTTIVPAYGFLVLGRSNDGNDNNPDVNLDYVYDGITLADAADEIILQVAGTEICRVNYSDGNNFGAGVAHEIVSLNGHSTGITQGPTSGSDYQAAIQVMTSGDLGSPGNSGQVVLPVELLNFTAIPNDQTVILNWTTATETNNAYFNIQHSTDGKNFETIGTKTGAGTTYEVQEYTFIDENLINGLNYYRLQQVDFDGKFENHKIVSVLITDEKNDVTIVPTQVHNQFDIIFKETIDANTQLEIYNINGQLVKSEIINRNKNRQTIDVTQLQAGVYFIRMNINNTMITKRFVKL